MSWRAKATDAQITAAVRDAAGHVLVAARILGLSREAVRNRLARNPRLWPSEVRPRREAVGDAVTAALRATEGSITRAATRLGIARATLLGRLRAAPGLWPSELPVPRGRGRALSPLEKDRTRSSVAEAGGDIRAAAAALGVSAAVLHSRVARDPSLHALAGALRERRRALLTDATRDALRAADGSLAGAAALLSITREAVRQRVNALPGVWPAGVPRSRRSS